MFQKLRMRLVSIGILKPRVYITSTSTSVDAPDIKNATYSLATSSRYDDYQSYLDDLPNILSKHDCLLVIPHECRYGLCAGRGIQKEIIAAESMGVPIIIYDNGEFVDIHSYTLYIRKGNWKHYVTFARV
jgi:hypothetical protein